MAQDITGLLLTAADASKHAESQQAWGVIASAGDQNPSEFCKAMVAELANESKPTTSRQIAGIALKNFFTTRETQEAAREAVEGRWLAIPAEVREPLRAQLVSVIASPVAPVRSAASMTLSRVAIVELNHSTWPDAIPSIIRVIGAAGNDGARGTALECLGYICEDVNPDRIKEHYGAILTVVVQAMRETEPDASVRSKACRCLLATLDFIRDNMDNEAERTYLLNVIFSAAGAPDTDLRETALECLVRVADVYYQYLQPYMPSIVEVTFRAVQECNTAGEDVAKQGLEFWMTLTEVETALVQIGAAPGTPEACHNFVAQHVQQIVELCCQMLTTVSSTEPESGEWGLPTAAGVCITLVAALVRDAVVPHVMKFVEANIQAEWNKRDAVLVAFGQMFGTDTSGPSKETLTPLVRHGLDPIMMMVRANEPRVQQSAAWVAGRIVEFVPEAVLPERTEALLACGREVMFRDSPIVAHQGAFIIQRVAGWFNDQLPRQGPLPQTSALSPYWQKVVEGLVTAAGRSDGNVARLWEIVYEGLSEMISAAAADVMHLVVQLLPQMIARLASVIEQTKQCTNPMEAVQLAIIQGKLAGVLQPMIRKLHETHPQLVRDNANQMMKLFMDIFQVPVTGVTVTADDDNAALYQQEALMAVGSLAEALGPDFGPSMLTFRPALCAALNAYTAPNVVATALGVAEDVIESLGTLDAETARAIMSALLQGLREQALKRFVKPAIVSVIGTMALVLQSEFVTYLPTVMNVFRNAGMMSASRLCEGAPDQDTIEWVSSLRFKLAESYDAIFLSLKRSASEHVLKYLDQLLEFVETVWLDSHRTDEAVNRCVTLLGSISTFGPMVTARFTDRPKLAEMIHFCSQHQDPDLRQTAAWTTAKYRENS
eukprot:TRINITY_DN2405_c0_g1_i1.p1 TRINITY_DN2405_c0_g1~~TRINITY_DN2405_c0_g1_i1.p1  ORF type:complete len:889 (-),score=219.59 TRINITY_DN2405_c0_g1_i1:264-2930(-)